MALAREITGAREETIETDNSTTVMDLLRLLGEKHGERMREYLFDPATGKPHPYLQFLMDGRSIHMISGFETTLTSDSTLQIIPPVSGG
jgi:molybdopterin converting factor small subunit